MPKLESFIGESHRPEINGGRLDLNHQTKCYLDYSIMSYDEIKVNAIAFGPKKDNVLLNLEYAIKREDEILVFYYEDIHKKWSFVETNTECYFLFKKNDSEQFKVYPNCLYIRGCQVDVEDHYWILLGEFYNFVDSWDGKVVCAPNKQNNNESKLYQLNTSLLASCEKNKNISIGKSYVIKGHESYEQLPIGKSYIVKSLSGIRSIVVDEKDFKNWNQSNINNLPVLFQEKVDGNDLRVHVVNGNVYGKLSSGKEEVDYRYDSNFCTLQDFNDFTDELRQFCKNVTIYEDNPLMGIDFIKTNNQYVVLEANPSPGWSAYHECNGMQNDDFVSDLLMELKNV